MLLDCRGLQDRKSTRLNSSHTEIYTLSLHDALPISQAILSYSELLQKHPERKEEMIQALSRNAARLQRLTRSEEHTSELQSHRDLHSFPTRRSSDLSSYSFIF